ncbi:hypothetical protein [Parasphingorhabdus sp.]|uniref:hypothetical protein n=1 Tax=Parasphingorhabdus sp. TaxID=2709688 RepID=UPI002F949C9F
MTHFSIKKLVKPAMLGGAMLGLSACAYSGGSYGDNYVNGMGYACDPYAPFDDYYACDNSYGYANIGFGGGWYDDFYYPGYGIYVFDNRGSRHTMKNNHRRHWAQRRAEYGSRHDRRDRNRDWNRRDDRRQDLTPAQRAERRERWQERREDRSDRGDRRTYRRDRTNDDRSRVQPRSNRQGTATRAQRPTRSAAPQRQVKQKQVQQRQVQQRQAPAARAVPAARPTAKNGRNVVSRNKVNKD